MRSLTLKASVTWMLDESLVTRADMGLERRLINGRGNPPVVAPPGCGAIPLWLPHQGVGAGTGALPLRKIVVSAITVPVP